MSSHCPTHTSSITVLGAGLSGLSYSYGKIIKGYNITAIEKEGEIGGLMRTFNFNNFLFDFGPHIFRSKDVKVLKFVKGILNNNYHSIVSNPAIFKYGKFLDSVIPVITYKNVKHLPKNIRERAIREIKGLNNARKNPDLSDFKTCIISQIGETLYWEFFGEYSRKWWGIDPEKLSSDLAPKNIRFNKEKSYGHITTNFEKPKEEIYPIEGGIFKIIEGLTSGIMKFSGRIITNCKVIGLETDGEIIKSIIVRRGDDEIEIPSEKSVVVSTIPLSNLCKILQIKFNLLYRADICIFIKLKGKRMFNYSWIYFHDADVIFGRIYEPLYYSEYNAPKGYTSLCVEVTCFKDDSLWRDKYLGEKVVEQLLDLRIIKHYQEPEVLGIAKYPCAYPIYTVGYKRELKKIFKKLQTYKNLKVIGRTGSFTYLNMWECLRWAVY